MKEHPAPSKGGPTPDGGYNLVEDWGIPGYGPPAPKVDKKAVLREQIEAAAKGKK